MIDVPSYSGQRCRSARAIVLSILLVLVTTLVASQGTTRKSACAVWRISGLGGSATADEIRRALQLSEKMLQERIAAATAGQNTSDISANLILIRQLRLNVADE